MSEAMDRYRATLERMLEARGKRDEALENKLLEELDPIWRELSEDERGTARAEARVYAASAMVADGFREYQRASRETAIYPDKDRNLVYPTLGLGGESGEIMEKVKKIIRDKGGVVDDAAREALVLELGDVLWYVAAIASELEVDLGEVASRNLAKLASRKSRGTLGGSGDKR